MTDNKPTESEAPARSTELAGNPAEVKRLGESEDTRQEQTQPQSADEGARETGDSTSQKTLENGKTDKPAEAEAEDDEDLELKPGEVNFRKVFAKLNKDRKELTPEEFEERYPLMKGLPPPNPANASVAMAALDELLNQSDDEDDDCPDIPDTRAK
ncbi:hypothetical protein F66182_2735 [Fusarium sp. NRRL 66182]|nr:hypothetical protein F66182_2735 [Fusarium sp. NRRL 66182]